MQLVDLPRFGWDLQLNASHNSNKWLELGIDPTTGKERIIGAGLTTEQRQGYPLNAQWYKNYTWADKNGDHVIQQSEVTVDTARFNTGYSVPRDIVSIQTGFDLLRRNLRISASFDYRGGGNTPDGTNGFDCTSLPQGCQREHGSHGAALDAGPRRGRHARHECERHIPANDARLLCERPVLALPRAVGDDHFARTG